MGVKAEAFRLQRQASLTQRAPDLGYAPRFQAFFVALSFSRFAGDPTLPPQAGNANRWAAGSCLKMNLRALNKT